MSRNSQHGVVSDSDGVETYHLVLLNTSQNNAAGGKNFIPNFNDSKDLLPSLHKDRLRKRAETTGNAGSRI